MGGVAEAAPQQATVMGGSSTISQIGNTTTIRQTTERSSINWQSFSIGSNEQVTFVQPNSSAISLDRVMGAGASTIYGRLTANGQVILINSNGILFEPGASVNLAGLIATTSNVSDSDFMAGKLNFSQASTNTSSATVYNEGTINVSSGGYAVLSAAAVANTGTITAKLGSVVLAGATAFTVDFDGDGLLKYAVTQDVSAAPTGPNGKLVHTLVEQVGTIAADGGQVLLTARAAQGIMHRVINMDGMTEANAVARTANGTLIVGAVTLDGGSAGAVEVTGSIQATNTAGAGGAVEVLGENVALSGVGNIQAWGTSAGGTVLFGGNEHGAGPQANAQSAYVGSGTTITANAVNKGNGGKVVVWSDAATWFAGKINVEGGFNGGNGGFAETSGKKYLGVVGIVDAKAAHGKAGEWLLDPDDITIAANEGGTSGGTFEDGVFTANEGSSSSTIDPSLINSALNNGTSVNIATSSGSGGSGNITVSAPITMNTSPSTTATLGLYADNAVIINAPINDVSGQLAVSLQGTVTVNANITANNGFDAQANTIYDTFTQTAGKTIRTGTGELELVYNSMTLTSIISSGGYGVITPETYGGQLGIGTGTGVTSTSGLVLSSNSLNALTGFGTLDIGSYSNSNSIIFGGTVTIPAAGRINFNAGDSITVMPGADISFPAPAFPTGSFPVVEMQTGGEGYITIGSGALMNLGVTQLGLTSYGLSLPMTAVFANSSIDSRVTIDTANGNGSIGIGTGTGQMQITDCELNTFNNFPGLLWIGGANTSSVDFAGTVHLPTQSNFGPYYTGEGEVQTSITVESGASITTAPIAVAGTRFAGLNFSTNGYNSSITVNSGATITVGGGTFFLTTDNLSLNGSAGSISSPAVVFNPSTFSQTNVGSGVGSGGGILTITQADLDMFTGVTNSPGIYIQNNTESGVVNVGTINLAYGTVFSTNGGGSGITITGAVTGADKVGFFTGNGGTITLASGASVSAHQVWLQGGGASNIEIAGSITSTTLEIEAGIPGQAPNFGDGVQGVNYGTSSYGGLISLGPKASITTDSSAITNGYTANTILYTAPGGTIIIASGATIDFGAGNLALIADNLSVSSPPGAISGSSRVIIAPSLWDGYLVGPYDTVLSRSLLAQQGGYANDISIGTNLDPGSWNVSQQLINALSTNVGRLQIGTDGATGGLRVAGTVNFPAETDLFAGDILIDSSARITVTGTTTFDNPNGQADGLLLNAAWDGQPGDATGIFAIANHGNIGIEPGAVITVGGFLQMISTNWCSSNCTTHSGVLLDGTITAGSILYADSGVGANVIIGPNAVLTSTGSATTGGIQISPDVGGSITLIGGATINTGAALLTLTTDDIGLGINGNLTINNSGVATTIPLASTGSLVVNGAGVLIDTAEAGQAGLKGNSSPTGGTGATIGVAGDPGTLQLSLAAIQALSQNTTVYVGDTATQVAYGYSTVDGPLTFTKTCLADSSCGGTSNQIKTALGQVTALAGQRPVTVSTIQGSFASLDLSSLGIGTGGKSAANAQESSDKSGSGSGGFGSGDAANSPSGQAASGPKPAQPVVLMPGKLVSLPSRPPDPGNVPGLDGGNSSLGNSGAW